MLCVCCCTFLVFSAMSSSELRFRRTVKIDGKEETVDLLTLALKREAEYDKVRKFVCGRFIV